MSADANGNLVYVYDGATVAQGPQQDLGTALDERRTHLERAHVAVGRGRGGNQPHRRGQLVLATCAPGTWQTTGNNTDVWNVYYRSSTDGGVYVERRRCRISDATSGAAYKTTAGFVEVYGDYGEIAVTNTGKTVAVWGEGTSYTGPGGVWFNRQTKRNASRGPVCRRRRRRRRSSPGSR